MAGKKWTRICALILAAVFLAGVIPGQGYKVYAKAWMDTGTEVLVNPLYADSIDEEGFVKFAQLYQSANNAAGLSESREICETAEVAAAYIREQMVQRCLDFTFWINASVLSDQVTATKLFENAMEHTEECSGQEGDALLFGWKRMSVTLYDYAGEYCQLQYTIEYHTNAEQEKALMQAVDNAFKSMDLDGLSEYEKVMRIYTYICENVNYDYSYSRYSAYDALCNKTAVCQGYAVLFYRLAKEAGLSVRIISGWGNYERHAWNIVKIDGRYYNVDCTWDGQDDNTYYYFFLKNDRDFVDHIRDEEYTTSGFRAACPMAEKSWKEYRLVLDKNTLVVDIGDRAKLTVAAEPYDVGNNNVIWTTSDPGVAIVDQDGNVTAVGEGVANVTASAADGSGVCVSCRVTARSPFADVPAGSWYYDPVCWAVKHGITNGYGSATTFCPDITCNRGQVVTFLWRASGSPEPTSLNNPFIDVAEDAYYYKAVLWAVEKGITAGYGSDSIFNPDGACNRGQVATFLWRANGKPGMGSTSNPFTDVAADQYYYEAVLWAVENGITNGYGGNTTFAPDVNCSRGQIVTFLYRAMN